MGKAIEKAKKHFQAIGTKRIQVPEWSDDDGPFFVYYNPMTLEELFQYKRIMEEKGELDGFIHVLIAKAKDQVGEKLFEPDDKIALKKGVDGRVLSAIAKTIMSGDTVDEAEKN